MLGTKSLATRREQEKISEEKLESIKSVSISITRYTLHVWQSWV